MKRKSGLGSLLLAGLAAYGIYQLSKMSSEERDELIGKGKKMFTDSLGNLSNILGKENGNASDIVKKYGEHSYS